MTETILIVDDEESVRRTFHDWLSSSGFGCEVHSVGDAEAALLFADKNPVDLAILDWNLGSGSDGLQLLEDLVEFHPDLVAILVTGFAHQATPLDALRMGVRDYLDKNQDLNRETFLASVKKQLDRIIPAKRQRQFTHGLFQFRESVEKVLPLVQASAALNDPVPLTQGIRSLLAFLQRTTKAADAVLITHHRAANGTEQFRAYDRDGQSLPQPTVPYSRSLAASVASMQEACVMNTLEVSGALELQPFEAGRRNALAAPLPVGAGMLAVFELFDKADGHPFTDEDRILAAAAADFGAELLRQALAERQTNRTLFDAVDAALKASTTLTETLTVEATLPDVVMDRLKEGLHATDTRLFEADDCLRLAEAVRELARRHGSIAVAHCITLIESLRRLLDEMTGA